MNIRLSRKFSLFLAIAALVSSSLACQAVMGGGSVGLPSAPSQPAVQLPTPLPQPTTPPVQSNGPAAGFVNPATLTQLYQVVNPGVVSIRILTAEGASGLGSGFVIDNQGHIVTNYHVIEGVDQLELSFANGYKSRGTVVGYDLNSDLAVIKADAPESQLSPLPLGDSDAIQVGDMVVAIGNPFGLSGTMTIGIVSAKGRVLDSMNTAPGGGTFSAGDMIQTDAAINPGNSGGPLLNLNGEVIGVNRAIRTTNFTSEGEPTNSGIGFAISVNVVRRVVNGIIENGAYQYPYLGISAFPELNLLIQEQFNLPQATGAYVTNVVSSGPADQAGLQVGDLITKIDGREVMVFADLLNYLIVNKSPGDTIELTLLRNNRELTLDLTVGVRP